MRVIFLILAVLALTLGVVRNSIVDTSNELKKAETYEKLIACLFLIEMKFDSSRPQIAERLVNSPHKDKSKLYDKFYYATLKFCMGKIKQEDWKFIPKNFGNPQEVDKLNIVWIISNEMNEKVLKDKKGSLDLDDEELEIKEFIDHDEKIEQYLHKIEKPLKKKPEAEMKVEESQNIQQESEKKEEKEEKIEKTTNEIPNMSSVDQNYIIFGSIGLILAIFLLCCCFGGDSKAEIPEKSQEKPSKQEKKDKAERPENKEKPENKDKPEKKEKDGKRDKKEKRN